MLEQEDNNDGDLLNERFSARSIHRNMVIVVIIITYAFLFLITLFNL